jgi:FMN phosphatase YigB (HAD superfamily)
MASNIVFLFDVDNTLLDNDHVTADLKRHLHTEVGEERSHRYWQFFEAIRSELGYADYLGALQRYRLEYPRDPKLLAVSYFLMRYPFANRLFPGSLDAIQHVGKGGTPVILSDGDVVFQPHKVYRSGLYEEFNGHVLIYVHKELEMDDVEQRFPAEHYVMVDDKLRILEAMKKIWKNKLTTVFVKQGHYAHDPKTAGQFPPADVSLERIGDLVNHDVASLRAAGSNLKHEGKSA